MATTMTAAERKNIILNLWVARAIPIILAGAVGYATYVIVALLCVDYLLIKHNDTAAAIPILIFYFLLFIILAASFFRLIYVTTVSPPFVALGAAAAQERKRVSEKGTSKDDGIGSGEYNAGSGNGHSVDSEAASHNLDPPGLEQFYTRDVFVSEWDGRPKWCSTCGNWKPDRAHHCSSSGRCIYRMDHFCPWVGGPIGENNFKFFILFTGYAALYCTHIGVVMAIYVYKQNANTDESINNHFIASLALSAFFGLFTAGMTGTSIELAVKNLTQVEKLGAQTRMHILAIIKPSHSGSDNNNQDHSNLESPEITYPLGTGQQMALAPWKPDSNSIAKDETEKVEATVPSQSSEQQAGRNPSIPEGGASLEVMQAFPGSQGQESLNSNPSSRDISSGSTAVTSEGLATSTADVGVRWPTEAIAARDLQATRTFVITKVPIGQNPWDLGSALLNWKSVMGTNVLDWFLPIRRSPCSQHDDNESYYQLGPVVDVIRAQHNLNPATSATSAKKHRRNRYSASVETSFRTQERSERHHKKRRRRHHSNKVRSADLDHEMGLSDLNGRE